MKYVTFALLLAACGGDSDKRNDHPDFKGADYIKTLSSELQVINNKLT